MISTVFIKKISMKNLLLILAICLTLSCKKDLDKKLTTNDWNVESAKINPAMTIGTKSSTNYLELMGPASCAATTTLTFSEDGIFTSSANGALCDRFYDPKAAPATWSREGNQIIISSMTGSPYTIKGNTLTHTTTFTSGGTTYTLVQVYKAK